MKIPYNIGLKVSWELKAKIMIGDTLTLKNLNNIYKAMLNIKSIDRSNYFTKYLTELKWRIEYLKKRKQ